MPGDGHDSLQKEVNIVHQNSILCETIRKEDRFFQLYTDYRINPSKTHVLTGKPNSKAVYDMSRVDELEDLEIFQTATKFPREKYDGPVTESMEIGWDSEPLTERSLDPRIHHPRIQSAITKFHDHIAKG